MADESKAPQSSGGSEPEFSGSSAPPSAAAASPTSPENSDAPAPLQVSRNLLQPIADALRPFFKEDLIPENADWFIFWIAPIISMTASITSLGGIAFGPRLQMAQDINIGLLFVVGVSALIPVGIVLSGSASNNHFSMVGALRSTARLISYEIIAGFALVSGLLLAGTLNLRAIVETQRTDHAWYCFLAPLGFFLYLIASIGATNRALFDLPETESEPVAREKTAQCGFRSSLYFLTDYASMIVLASVGTTLFLGGWLRPFPNVRWFAWLDAAPLVLLVAVGAYCVFRAGKRSARAQSLLPWAVALASLVVAAIFALASPFGPLPFRPIHEGLYGAFWFSLKASAYICIFIGLRFMLPRFRFHRLMRLGWHILIPLALINVVAVGIALALTSEFGINRWLAMVLTTGATLAVAVLLVRWNGKYSAGASAALAADSPIAGDIHA
ncbi:MAG TPA: complex I subunit 1 family protein [Candidatus Acidoferrum sp.]|nr:complex I subunit 1 family protein [Candidatus Acidoferrum sp.]